jgi:hypothetical protein
MLQEREKELTILFTFLKHSITTVSGWMAHAGPEALGRCSVMQAA